MKTKIALFILLLAAFFLRVYKLDQNPPSLYWDEVSLGYNAFSILTTGHDEHGEFLPIARFVAFGDYKPPGYIYAIVPFMAVLGVTELAVRFPSALAGMGMVILTYYLSKTISGKKEIALISAALLAFSPWSLQLSRAAFEAHLAAFFNLAGVYLFILSLTKRWVMPFAFICFMLSFYTFTANRIIAPLIIGLLCVVYLKEVWSMKKWLVFSAFLCGLLLLPSISFLQSRESKLRFHEVSIFTSLDTVKKSNERIERAGNTWWAHVLHNRRVYFARDFLTHYLDHFKGEFLFVKGDRNPRFSIQNVGVLHTFEIPLLLSGVVILLLSLKSKNKTAFLLFGWILVAPIPAGMARETPHMLRIASILPTLQVVSAIGFYTIWRFFVRKHFYLAWTVTSFFSLFIVINLFYYFHNYWIHYPRDWSGEWQYGYKQMVNSVTQIEPKYDRINVTSAYGRPYIYFLFYNQVNPLEYVATRRAERDWYGLWNVNGFGKYQFDDYSSLTREKVLTVATKDTIAASGFLIDSIQNLKGVTVFEIGEL